MKECVRTKSKENEFRSFIAKTSACEKKSEVSFVFEQNAGIRNNAIRLFVTNLVGVEDRREYGMHRKVGRSHRDYGERAFARARCPSPAIFI